MHKMTFLHNGPEDVILGTNGEKAIVAALKFYVRSGGKGEVAEECVRLLFMMGILNIKI